MPSVAPEAALRMTVRTAVTLGAARSGSAAT
jgi:hypothetical protein